MNAWRWNGQGCQKREAYAHNRQKQQEAAKKSSPRERQNKFPSGIRDSAGSSREDELDREKNPGGD
jgi:hypothetical protein